MQLLKTAVIPSLFLLSANAHAATVESVCINDSIPIYDYDPYTGDPIYLGEDILSTTCSTSTTYGLTGVGTSSTDPIGLFQGIHPDGLQVTGTLVLSTWTFEDYYNGLSEYGNSTSLNLSFSLYNDFLGTGATDFYVLEQGISYDANSLDEFGNPVGVGYSWETSSLTVAATSLWDIQTVGDLATAVTLDGNQDGVDGVMFIDPIVLTENLTVDFQLTTAVPVPAAAWLFGSGLLGLLGVARRRACA